MRPRLFHGTGPESKQNRLYCAPRIFLVRLFCAISPSVPGATARPPLPHLSQDGAEDPQETTELESYVISRHARVVLSITDLGVGPNNITRHHPLAICHRVQRDVDGSS